MPRVIECSEADAIGLGDFLAALDESGFDPRDEEAFAALAPLLKRLANNRRFLGEHIVSALTAPGAPIDNEYGPQVVMLHRARDWFVRANFWPSPRDALYRISDDAPFFYGVPHDHNFSFLTAGYFGPGYWSDHYEYDHGAVAGYPGERVELRFVGRERLAEGMVMLYRAHRDIHAQFPPDALSVSLNIMELSDQAGWIDQYRFDVARGEIAGIMNAMPSEALLGLAAMLGGEEGAALLADFARRHPHDRMRYAARAALALREAGAGEAEAVLSAGTRDPSAQVRALCEQAIARIARHADWVEPPAPEIVSGSERVAAVAAAR